jgi:uncharacterized membrane protein YphA (DoxX/SURF4 family)
MGKLSATGRIFYGIAMGGLGLQTIYYKDLPYMLIPLTQFTVPALTSLAFISGTMLVLAGVCIVFEKKSGLVSLVLGTALLLIFCLYYIPYEFMVSPNYRQLGDWDNAEKELALSGGAFAIAGCYPEKNNNPLIGLMTKLIPFGIILFAISILSFGIDHFLYAKGVAEYAPSWIPNRIVWIYLAGTGLAGSAIAIILKIKTGLFAILLGTMIFTWFIILHIPKVIASPFAEAGGEITSAFLALAYSGIAFIIAGTADEQSN